MTNKDVTPKVHLFDKLDKLQDEQTLMVILPGGEKLQASVLELKQFILKDVLREIEEIEENTKKLKVTRESVLSAFKKVKSINFGKPFNILADIGIEKIKTKGTLYSDGKRVRVNLDGKWRTLKLEDAN